VRATLSTTRPSWARRTSASTAQWQCVSLVNWRSWVQSPAEAWATHSITADLQLAALSAQPCARATALCRPGGREGARPSTRRSRACKSTRAPGVKPGSRAREARATSPHCARLRRHRARGPQRLGATSRRKPRLKQFGGPFVRPARVRTAGLLSHRRPRCDFPKRRGPVAQWMRR
jgi:hypothetical protein